MAKFTPRRYEQILSDSLAYFIATSGLSDVADTSVMKHLLAAVARSHAELYYQMQLLQMSRNILVASGTDLDQRAADIQPGTVARRQSAPAVTTLVFSRTGVTGTASIPQGTRVQTAGGIVFATTATGSITPTSTAIIGGHVEGQDSGQIPATAQAAGSAGNVAANTLIALNSRPPGVNAVTNTSAATLGADLESDDAFRNRLQSYVASLPRSTNIALETAVLGAQVAATGQTVLYSHIYEDPTTPGVAYLYVDDGTGQADVFLPISGENMCLGLGGPPATDEAAGGETLLFLRNVPVRPLTPVTLVSSQLGTLVQGSDYFLNTATGQVNFAVPLVTNEVVTAAYSYFTGIVQLAQKIVDGDPADRTDYPGYRAAGCQVIVQAPVALIQTVTASLTVVAGYDEGTTATNAKTAIVNFINSLPISGDLLVANLFATIMGVPGVANCTLTTPTADVVMTDFQLARTTTANVTVA